MVIVLVECVSAMTVREIIPAEWELSAIVNSRNEKGEKRNYRIAERVIEKLIRQQVHIDKMSLVFTPGCRPTNKIAILIQLQEIYLQKKKEFVLCI